MLSADGCEQSVSLDSRRQRPYHQPPHPLLLDPLRLFFLLPFRVGMPGGHCFGKLLDLASHRPMILLKVFCMLQNTVQVFLKEPQQGEGWTSSSQLRFNTVQESSQCVWNSNGGLAPIWDGRPGVSPQPSCGLQGGGRGDISKFVSVPAYRKEASQVPRVWPHENGKIRGWEGPTRWWWWHLKQITLE